VLFGLEKRQPKTGQNGFSGCLKRLFRRLKR